MNGNGGQWRQRLQQIIQKFREKGAISPEKALTIQELGLPPRFEEAMHRRLGQTGIFVEAGGKYYLDEARLKQIQERRANANSGGGYSRGGTPTWSRYAGLFLMLPIGIIVAFVLFYLFYFGGVGYFPGELIIIVLIVALGLFVARMLFWRSRRNYWRDRWMQNQSFIFCLS